MGIQNMTNKFEEKLNTIIKKEPRFLDQEGDLLTNTIIDSAYKADSKLIELLISDKEIKDKFFTKIKDVHVFNINDFVSYIQDKNFLNDSYTKFKNKIGLNVDGKFLNERKEVSLVWPFKDCVLEGGMTKEDEKRKEIFFNEILAEDDIDKLLAPKVLTNWERFTKNGKEKVKELKRDKNGVIRENLVIKGNNLLALHSLKEQFAGQVKLIYIDPPYNTETDSFGYNDNFSHSSWLTFMKNRIEIAKKLLNDQGVIFIQCDDNEQSYLKVLMDETFGRDKFVGLLVWQRAKGGGQAKQIVKGHDYILVYKNFNENVTLKRDKSLQKKIIEIKGKSYIKNDDFIRKVFGKYSDDKSKDFDRRCFYEEIEKLKGIEKKKEVDEKIKSGEYVLEKHASGNHIICRLEPLDESYSSFYSIIKNVSDDETPVIQGFLSEVGKDDLNDLGISGFDYPKPVGLIKMLIKSIMMFDEEGIVLDFFAGSGTTAQAVLELNKENETNFNFILCEQMNYVESITLNRVGKVTKNTSSNFVYCELMKYNEQFIENIKKAKDFKILLKIWKEMRGKAFFNYNVDLKVFEENIKEFEKLSLSKQKDVLISLLNKNQLYVNLSDIEDSEFKVGKEDKELNKEFYG